MVKKSLPSYGRSLLDVAPSIAEEWHPTRNGHFTPNNVSVFSAMSGNFIVRFVQGQQQDEL